MKAKLIFLKKTVLFILSMLCFYFGARAQQYRLKEYKFEGRNNNVWLNQFKEVSNYTSLNLPFDFATETVRYQPDPTNNNNWLISNKKINNYNTTSPFSLQEENEFPFQNGQYATQANQRTSYTYSSIGVNSQEVRLTKTFSNGSWIDAFRVTVLRNPQGKTLLFSQEIHNGTTFFPEFEVTISYTASGEQLETIRTTYDYTTGAFVFGEKNTYTYSGGILTEELIQRKQSANGSFSDFAKEIYTYNGTQKTETVTYQPKNGVWTISGRSIFTYNNNIVTETTEIAIPITNTYQNIAKITSTSHVPSGKIAEQLFQVWANNNWLDNHRATWIYESSTATSTKNEKPLLSVEIFPNPTSDYIQLKDIEFTESIPYTIVNAEGRILQSSFITSENDMIEISDLPKGSYFLLLNKKETQPIKFVKM